jgi:hypothetical protein
MKSVAKPGPSSDILSQRYAPRWYCQSVEYDGANRPVKEYSGAKVQELQAYQSNQSFVTYSYSKRGGLKQIGSSYGDLVGNLVSDADGP